MEDVADGDGGPWARALDLRLLEREAVLAAEDKVPGRAVVGVGAASERAGADVEGREVADRGEGLAAEAVGGRPVEIVARVLAREVPAVGRGCGELSEVEWGDAVARVVAAEGPGVEVDGAVDGAGVRVEAVLDELLEDALERGDDDGRADERGGAGRERGDGEWAHAGRGWCHGGGRGGAEYGHGLAALALVLVEVRDGERAQLGAQLSSRPHQLVAVHPLGLLDCLTATTHRTEHTMAKNQLVDSSDDDGGLLDTQPDLSFKVNDAFAEKYDLKKRGEELSKRACTLPSRPTLPAQS